MTIAEPLVLTERLDPAPTDPQRDPVVVAVRRVGAAGEDLPLPAYETDGAAGLDVRAAIAAETSIRLKPGERKAIPTGLAIALPPGFEAQIRPRSGLAMRQGITLLNAPGTIDADYRGEIKVLLINLGEEDFVVKRGDRIAQMVIAPVSRAELMLAEALPETQRGDGGFGSTGV